MSITHLHSALGKVIKLITNKETMYFPTPVGKAYQCDEETEIKLEGSKDISASVLLRELKLQPFIFKNDEFGPGKRQNIAGRDMHLFQVMVLKILPVILLCPWFFIDCKLSINPTKNNKRYLLVGDSSRLFPKIAPIRSNFFSILNFTYFDPPYK
jgi:hypothetical protein